jgi:transposase-like protein
VSQYVFFLLRVIAFQNKIIIALMLFAFGKKFEYLDSINKDSPCNKPYRKIQIDPMPIIEPYNKFHYQALIEKYQSENGKPLKPVQHQKNSKAKVPESIICERCGAPHIYIYDNQGGKGQYSCKVCKHTFYPDRLNKRELLMLCPFCRKTLELIKERDGFDIYKCKNDNCSFYIKNKTALTSEELATYKLHPEQFKLRYIYRKFNFDFKPLDKSSPVKPAVDLSKIHHSAHTLGLILTYHINFALTARATSQLMQEVHGLKISHQTILNYANTCSLWLKPLIDNYPYQLSNSICGDETYIKVLGKWNYIFFFFDPEKKLILSNRVSPTRDTLTAIKALNDAFSKYDKLPEKLLVGTDGNPIYNLAQHFYAQEGIHFNLKQIIGLENKDDTSREYRVLKQIIERLNRTLKHHYKNTNGYNSGDGANSAINMFTAYFNFLRPHSSLDDNTPVVIPSLNALPHMPARWGKLLEIAQTYIETGKISA